MISLGQYSVFVCEQSYQIKEALDECEYHYNMVAYYLKKSEEG